MLRTVADTLSLADLADSVQGVAGIDYAQPLADTLALADQLTASSAAPWRN